MDRPGSGARQPFIAVIGAAAYNTAHNLQKAGLTSGFGFLDEVAGFDISLTLISYSRASTYGRAFLVGLLNTLLVSGIAIVLSTVLGFVIGVTRLSSNWLISRMAAVYVESSGTSPCCCRSCSGISPS